MQACTEATTNSSAGSARQQQQQQQHKRPSVPPDGYVCKLCQTKGHWIQRCPEKKKNKHKNRSNKNPNHVYRPGIDPSKEDIEKARALQKIEPPPCFCGIPSRLKKVKRSFAAASNANGGYTANYGNNDNHGNSNNGNSYKRSNNNSRGNNYNNGNPSSRDNNHYYGSSNNNNYNNSNAYIEPDYEHSRAIGKYFFFCSKKRDDPTRCRFARPVEQHQRESSSSSSSSVVSNSKSNYSSDVPPHRRGTGSSFASRQQEDRQRMREVKVDEEFEKLKKELGL
mmetsp:Transcript_5752/g.13369  ORF Transcript_5752/g.13369 Transcript_5752/m.13369 type:complete len:281 (-) Transcript_5752:165-1007(-)